MTMMTIQSDSAFRNVSERISAGPRR